MTIRIILCVLEPINITEEAFLRNFQENLENMFSRNYSDLYGVIKYYIYNNGVPTQRVNPFHVVNVKKRSS